MSGKKYENAKGENEDKFSAFVSVMFLLQENMFWAGNMQWHDKKITLNLIA